jgi:hypothetical protein
MWPVYFIVSYFLLALLIPVCWSLAKTWRFARGARVLTCPPLGNTAQVALDPWFAMRRHALGADDFRVLECSHWPERRDCTQECLAQIAPRPTGLSGSHDPVREG